MQKSYENYRISGDYSGEETHVPIPNTDVKLSSADGTAWVTVWESKTLPGIFLRPFFYKDGLFFCKIFLSVLLRRQISKSINR